MSDNLRSRRDFLRGMVLGAAALPLVRSADVFAAEAALPHLAESDPTAKALGYTENAAKIDPAKEPTYKQGTKCSSCSLYQSAQAQKGYAPCGAFPGKTVNANGWCRAFAAKS
ncbi:MAG: high-potential iron-sulfur protein [Nevskiales bacterium]